MVSLLVSSDIAETKEVDTNMLTDSAIKALKPEDKPRKTADRDGLYLLIKPNGTKLWQQSYRFAGKQKVLSHGIYDTVTLSKARAKCDAARVLLADGKDPGLLKQQKKATQKAAAKNTFKQIAKDYLKLRAHELSPRHIERTRRRLELHIYPVLGDKAIDSITPEELLKQINKIVDAGTIETANRVLQLCGRVFRYAGSRRLVTTDITSLLKDLVPNAKKNHFAAPADDPALVGELLRAMDGFKGSQVVRAALQLAPMLFARPGELRTMKWSEIDLEKQEWSYTITKTDTRQIVPLSTQAVDILSGLARKDDYVFYSSRSGKRPMSDNALLAALRRMGIEKDELVIHGWRAVARTMLVEEMKEPQDYVEHQLGHAVIDANGRAYNRTSFIKERHRMMQRWSDYLDGLKHGVNVVPIHNNA